MNVTIAPSFVPNPPWRGTLGLVWECLFTYFLCLWTVVHADVRGSKLWYCGAIFFFPEATLFLVLYEYLTAREVCRRANKDIRDRPLSTDTGLQGDEIPVDLALLTSSSQSHLETGHDPSCPVSQKIVGRGQ